MDTPPQGAAATRAPWLARHAPLVGGITAILAATLLGLLVVVRGQGTLLGIDAAWSAAITRVRSPVGEGIALFFDTVGGHTIGTFVIPLGVLIAFIAVRRPWAGTFFIVCSIVSALAVQLLKRLFARARPEDMLITSDFGSFPSGHVANAATIAVALGILFPVVWVRVAGAAWTVLMALSRTYLGAHWLTDTLGGALVGAGVVLVLWGLFAARLEAERQSRLVRGRAPVEP